MPTPIFLVGLPRSGSTLLQRMVAAHPDVATLSEPWLLLPLFLGYRNEHIFSCYHQKPISDAFADLLQHLPDGTATYHAAVRHFASTFYSQACSPGQTHFLDKTPRYHLILNDLSDTFPDSPIIILWRNPLAIAASCMETWEQGYFNLYKYRIDLYQGLQNMTDFTKTKKDRIFALRYEELVREPHQHMRDIFQYLDLSPCEDWEQRFQQVHLTGKMGDKKGYARFTGIDPAPCDGWKRTLSTIPRKMWARRYLRWIGRDRLAEMGYDQDDLWRQVNAQTTRWNRTISDILRMVYGQLSVTLELPMYRKKRALARQGVRVDVMNV